MFFEQVCPDEKELARTLPYKAGVHVVIPGNRGGYGLCAGALFNESQSVLLAGHCIEDWDHSKPMEVFTSQRETIPATVGVIAPSYRSNDFPLSGDLAVVNLTKRSRAPSQELGSGWELRPGSELYMFGARIDARRTFVRLLGTNRLEYLIRIAGLGVIDDDSRQGLAFTGIPGTRNEVLAESGDSGGAVSSFDDKVRGVMSTKERSSLESDWNVNSFTLLTKERIDWAYNVSNGNLAEPLEERLVSKSEIEAGLRLLRFVIYVSCAWLSYRSAVRERRWRAVVLIIAGWAVFSIPLEPVLWVVTVMF